MRTASSFNDFLPELQTWKERAAKLRDDSGGEQEGADAPQLGAVEEQGSVVCPAPAQASAAVAVDDDDPVSALAGVAGRACVSVLGEPDPVEAALEAMANRADPVDVEDELLLRPSAQDDVIKCLDSLGNLPTSGPDLAQQALEAIIAAGKLSPMLPSRSGQTKYLQQTEERHADTKTKRPGSIILRLGTADFYLVEVVGRKNGTSKWAESTARLYCSRLELIRCAGQGEPRVKFRLAHDGLHCIEEENSLPLVSKKTPTDRVLIDSEEEFLADLEPDPATDADKLRCYAMALVQLNKRDVRGLRQTGHAILGACCRCNPLAVGPTTRNNIATLLRKWDYHPLFEGVLQRFSQD